MREALGSIPAPKKKEKDKKKNAQKITTTIKQTKNWGSTI
jgi:hypothetical protein